MISMYDISLLIYNFCLIPVVCFSIIYLIFSFISLFIKNKSHASFKMPKDLPMISVQVPSFNDPIAERCVRKCMEFDYPKDKFEVLIVDDSTNMETQNILKNIAIENPGFVKYVHRTNRDGYKPGALRNAMKFTKGEIIVVFDADWIPASDFLKKIVKPFSDPKVAIVQARQGFYNHDTNLITRFAAYTLMTYHTIMMPINNKINCVFFCGTAGGIRRTAFEEVGGWNTKSITEDSELSVKILLKGYKTVYLEDETPSEVPDTLESFIKQQMRWCYGNARIFFDNFKSILFGHGLNIKQRLMITYITLGNIITPFVVIMTFFGFSGWFLGEAKLFQLSDLVNFLLKFVITAGFLIMGIITLKKNNKSNEFGYLVASIMTMGIVISISNSIAFSKAAINKNLSWYCTPKIANKDAIK